MVIGPEVPLVAGAADAVRAAGIACFGPSAQAARIEGSKAFAKESWPRPACRPRAAEVVDNPARAGRGAGRVRADLGGQGRRPRRGQGRGGHPRPRRARAHALTLLDGGHPVLLESFLDGPEASLFCLVDGTTVVPLLPAQDFKRVGDGDAGPNTGGMGAYAPLPWAPPRLVDTWCSGSCGRGGRDGAAGHTVLRAAVRRAGADLDRARR